MEKKTQDMPHCDQCHKKTEALGMHSFIIEDLICEACSLGLVDTIRNADPKAHVEIDLEQKRISVDSDLTRHELSMRLMEAGYEPK